MILLKTPKWKRFVSWNMVHYLCKLKELTSQLEVNDIWTSFLKDSRIKSYKCTYFSMDKTNKDMQFTFSAFSFMGPLGNY